MKRTTRSPFIAYWVLRALRRRLERNFGVLHCAGAPPLLAPGDRIVFYTNHPSWWDPAVFAFLQNHFLPTRAAYGPIDALALSRYPFLRFAGFLPVAPRSLTSVRSLITQARYLIEEGNTFWITAQGAFTDVRARPLKLRRGLIHIIENMPRLYVVPVALEYSFGSEPRADIFVRFGCPVRLKDAQSPKKTLKRLSKALQEAIDTQAKSVSTGDRAPYEVLMHHKHGVGGPYGFLRFTTRWWKKNGTTANHRAKN